MYRAGNVAAEKHQRSVQSSIAKYAKTLGRERTRRWRGLRGRGRPRRAGRPWGALALIAVDSARENRHWQRQAAVVCQHAARVAGCAVVGQQVVIQVACGARSKHAEIRSELNPHGRKKQGFHATEESRDV